MALPILPAASGLKVDPGRSCGACTACCSGWLATRIRDHDVGPGRPCPFLQAGACTIYAERPVDPCRDFFCGWRLADNPFPDDFRPDRLGVLVIACEWRGRIAYKLAPAGRDPDAALLDWFRRHAVAARVPFIWTVAGEGRAFGPPAFLQDVRNLSDSGQL